MSACDTISVSLGFSSDLWNNALMPYCNTALVAFGFSWWLCVPPSLISTGSVLLEHTAGTMREGFTKVVCMCVHVHACVHV